MLNKEITTILDQYNNEDGIAHVITASLIRYYSVNGFYGKDVEISYLNYLKTIFADLWIPKIYCHIEIRFSPRSWKSFEKTS